MNREPYPIRHPGTMLVLLTLLTSVMLPAAVDAQECHEYLGASKATPQGPYTPLEVDVGVVKKKRLCLKTFPWPEHDGDNPFDAFSSSQIERVRSKIRALNRKAESLQALGRRLSEEERMMKAGADYPTDDTKFQYAYRLMEGADPVQAELWASFAYVKKLTDQGSYAEALADIRHLRQRSHLSKAWSETPEAMSRIDVGDQGTYFRTSTLVGLLEIYEINALHAVLDSSKPRVSLLARLERLPLDELGSFASVESELRWDLQQRAARDLEEIEQKPSWDRLEGIEGAVGYSKDKAGTDVYVDLKDGNGVRIVRLEASSRRARVLTGDAVLEAFHRHNSRALREHSTPRMHLVNILKNGNGFEIQTADKTLQLTAEDVARLRRGEPLSEEHEVALLLNEPDRSLVIYSNPLMQRAGRFLRHAEEAAFLLQSAYPHARVYRDDFTERTARNAEKLRNLSVAGPGDVVVLVDKGSFDVDDKNLLNDISVDLRAASVNVVDYAPGVQKVDVAGKALVVITGHVDEKLARFVRELGAQGWFKDSFVVFNSCYADLSTQLVSEINSKFGAVGTYRYQGSIQPDRVGDMLFDVVEELNRDRHDPDFGKLLNRAARFNDLQGLWVICHVPVGREVWPT